MRGAMLLLALLVWGCSKGPQADLPSIGEARSLAAEWALVNQESEEGRLTPSYTGTMRKALREQLQTVAASLTAPNTKYGQEIAALLAEPDDATQGKLRAHADKLNKIENKLESD